MKIFSRSLKWVQALHASAVLYVKWERKNKKLKLDGSALS
jgi:hypothetical protein